MLEFITLFYAYSTQARRDGLTASRNIFTETLAGMVVGTATQSMILGTGLAIYFGEEFENHAPLIEYIVGNSALVPLASNIASGIYEWRRTNV